MNKCDHFLYLDEFNQLEAKAGAIAARAKARSTSTKVKTETDVVSESETVVDVRTETTVESYGVCSLDFLWALLAFLPLLLYILYRVVTIKLRSRSIRDQLYSKISQGEITRDDLGRLAHVATGLLLPGQRPGDIDYSLSYAMYRCCSCLLPANERELSQAIDRQCTLPL